MNQDETLVMIHVPRCGGTTLSEVLYHHFPVGERFIVGDNIPADRAKLAALPDAQKRAIRLLFGHQCWGWHHELPQECRPVTVLRDPAVRVISLYSYMKRSKNHYLYRYASSPNYPLGLFMEKGISCTVDNGIVRQLCGADRFLRDPFTDMAIPYGGVTREHLEQAKANLRQCAVVGVLERFDDFVRRLHEHLDLAPIPSYGRVNAITHDVPPRSAWDAVQEHVQLDQELYDYALELIYGH